MIEIKVPSVGESVTEARFSRWLKPDGAAVKQDESVCELETDKATAEVPAPAAGVLRHAAKEGDVVGVGAVIGRVDPAGVAAAAPAKPAPSAPAPAGPAKAEPILSPAARVAAAERGVDPASLAGTGRGGRITKEDVAAAPAPAAKAAVNGERPTAPPPAPAPPPARARPGSG